MDPNETLKIFVKAINDYDLNTAEQAFIDLGNWLAGGGFMPEVTVPQLLTLMENGKDNLKYD